MASIKSKYHPNETESRTRTRLRERATLMSYIGSRNRKHHEGVNVVNLTRNHEPFLRRLNFMKKLPVHTGCVNTIEWNKTGEYILSGSDDCNLCITKPSYMFDSSPDYTVLHKVPTRHLGNIFSARFIPNSGDQQIVSCSSKGPVIVHDICSIDPSEAILTFNCHSKTICDVVTVPDDDKLFLTCSDDKTVRLFDMRVHSSCARSGTCPHPALIRNSHEMTTLQLHPLNSNLMLIGRADGIGLVYDRRKLPDVSKFSRERAHLERLAGTASQSDYRFKHPLEGVVTQFTVPDMDEEYRFTSLCYNKDGTEVLASYSGDYIYLFSHDKSSNMELVQTLPKRAPPPEPTKDTKNGTGANDGNGDSDNGSSDKSEQARASRISRIRVRGDWSDTGVNSVPYSRRARDRSGGNSSERGESDPRISDRIAVSIGIRDLGDRRRIDTRNESTNSGESIAVPSERTIQEEDEEEDEDDDDDENSNDNHNDENVDEDDDENSTVIDEDIDMLENIVGGIDYIEDESVDEYGYREEFERFARVTVDNLIDEAHEHHAEHLGQTADESDESSRGRDEDASSNKSNSPSAGISGQRKTSEARAKFRKTVDDLKKKYNHIPKYKPHVKYMGHRNSRTSIKEAIFWGDNYVMSGSDCGRIMVWDKKTAKLLMAFPADAHVVNCLRPNPHHYVLASSGIDEDIKLWSTQSLNDEPMKVSDQEMSRIVENNEMMLEESKHTISVPPHLFFRVLASLVQAPR